MKYPITLKPGGAPVDVDLTLRMQKESDFQTTIIRRTTETVEEPPPTPTGPFVFDTFTDTDGTDVTTHMPELGGIWYAPDSYDFFNDVPAIKANGASIYGFGNSYRGVFSPTDPASANYALEEVIEFGPESDNFLSHQLMGRAQNSTVLDDFLDSYIVEWGFALGFGWRVVLYIRAGGASTELAAYVPSAPTPGDSHVMRFELNGPKLRVLLDGVERIAVTDSTYTTPGRVGWLIYGSWDNKVDEFTAEYL
jgi:hypothetical protein